MCCGGWLIWDRVVSNLPFSHCEHIPPLFSFSVRLGTEAIFTPIRLLCMPSEVVEGPDNPFQQIGNAPRKCEN